MKGKVDFDEHSEAYENELAESIKFIGGGARHFAVRKVHVLEHIVDQAPEKILDFGCGIGLLTRELAKRFHNARITGVDVSADSLRIARQSFSEERVSFTQTTPSGLPEALPQFDLIVAACVFHHIAPAMRDTVIRSLIERLVPGGRLVIFEHNPNNPLTRKAVRDCIFDQDAILLSPRECEKLLVSGGLSRVKKTNYLFLPPFLYSFRAVERVLAHVPIGGQYAVTGLRSG